MGKHAAWKSILFCVLLLVRMRIVYALIDEFMDMGMDPSMVAGTYCAEFDQGADWIMIDPDGAYTHTFKHRNGRVYEQAGAWDFECWAGETLVTFHEFEHYEDGLGMENRHRGFWPARVDRRITGKIRLVKGADSPVYYVKR